jgi:ribosomal protein S12 methylthiotransferase accessory factor YcaO
MGADKARKPVTAMSDLHAIENVGTPFEQRRPRRAYQLVFAYGQGAKRAHAAECNQHH